MQTIGKITFRNVVVLATLIFVFSCSKDDKEPVAKVSYQKVSSYTVVTIKAFLTSSGQSSLTTDVAYNIDVYTYNYPLEYQGNTITASGLVCVPVSSGKSFPVLSFQHGTIVAYNEAPSVAYSYINQISLSMVASLGYVMVIPDLIGFGKSTDYFHPYLSKQAHIDAVIGMLTSIKDLPDGTLSGASVNDSLFLAGYSQGGWITLATMDYLENQNSSNWNLIGTACGAGPYNPEQLMNYVLAQDVYPKPFFLAYVLIGYMNDGTLSNSLATYFKEPYASTVTGLFNGLNTGTTIDAGLTTSTHQLFNESLFNYSQDASYLELKNAYEANKVEAWQNETPLLLLHGEMDTYVPITISDSIYQQFIEKGSTQITYQPIPLNDHNTAAIPAIAIAIEWFQNLKISQ